MAVKHIPDGYHTVTPYLIAQRAGEVIDFLQRAFNAEEIYRSTAPNGTVAHAEIRIGDSMVMISEASDKYPALPSAYYLYVPDTDALYNQAIAAGAISIMEPADHFYGDRSGGVKDPAGNHWWIGTHIEDVSREELERRMAEAHNQQEQTA